MSIPKTSTSRTLYTCVPQGLIDICVQCPYPSCPTGICWRYEEMSKAYQGQIFKKLYPFYGSMITRTEFIRRYPISREKLYALMANGMTLEEIYLTLQFKDKRRKRRHE